MIPINYFAVVVNAVIAMAIGFAWYGPLFGKQWVELMGWSPAEMERKHNESLGPKYAIQALGALMMSFVLAHTIVFAMTTLGTSGIAAGVEGALWNWAGFIVPATLGTVLWDGKPWKLWFLNVGYFLVVLIVMGIVLSVWI